MDTDIWFPFYYGDYLKDTMQLSAERHGIYLLLMIHCWQNEFIEDDIESISMIAKVLEDSKSLHYILDKYFVKNDNKYYQNRITKELKCAKENKKKRTEKAKKAAGARWNKDATSNAPSIPQAMPEGMPEPCPSSSSSSSQSSLSTKSPRKEPKHKHGEYKHVLLTENEYIKLLAEYSNAEDMITNLDEYIETSGKVYKNHNLVLRKWEKSKKTEKKPGQTPEQELEARRADIRKRMAESKRMMEA